MYITYETRQWTVYDPTRFHSTKKHTVPPRTFNDPLPKLNDYTPNRLVHVPDMTVVSGSTVNEGYIALSYAWSQSGDILTDPITGRSIRHDTGNHKIIRSRRNNGGAFFRKTKHVPFEGVIQQICKDFNIKYLWFDQMCINQENAAEKREEIRQMHKIYSHAYCTIALIPEFCFEDQSEDDDDEEEPLDSTTIHRTSKLHRRHRHMSLTSMLQKLEQKTGAVISTHHHQNNELQAQCAVDMITKSEWFKRLWTLEEAIKSRKLLFIGRDIHVWSDGGQLNEYTGWFSKPVDVWNVSTMLFYAHIRASTNDHDRVYALSNIFPDIMDKRTPINYDNQSAIDLMIQFYALLAQHDLSILCFGAHNIYKDLGKKKSLTPACLLPWANDADVIYRMEQERRNRNANTTSRPPVTTTGYEVPIQKFALPSWTGVAGQHLVPNERFETSFKNYALMGNVMQITHTTGLTHQFNLLATNKKDASLTTVEKQDIPKKPDARDWYLAGITVRLPGKLNSARKVIALSGLYGGNVDQQDLDLISRQLKILSQFFLVNKKNLFWFYDKRELNHRFAEMRFNLTEDVDNSVHYVMLTEVCFKDVYGLACDNYYPVIKRNKGDNHYTAIGTCKITNPDYLFSPCKLPKKTFVIL